MAHKSVLEHFHSPSKIPPALWQLLPILPPAPRNREPTVCPYKPGSSRQCKQTKSRNMCSLVSGFLHLVWFFFFVLNLLGLHWLIQLYRFKVHNSIRLHLYNVCVFTTPSHVSFHHHLPPLYLLLAPPTPRFPLVMAILLPVMLSK